MKPDALRRLNVNELPWSLTEAPLGQDLDAALPAAEAPSFDIDLDALALNRYPDKSYSALRAQIGAVCGLDADAVVLTNGSDELIWLVLSVLLKPGDTLATHAPTFGEYERMADLCGLKTVYAPIEADFSTNLPNLLAVAARSGAKLVVICRPNNPTGELISEAALLDFLDRFKGYVLLDEAYMPFSGQAENAAALIKAYPNLILLRTFSKAYGMAGLRLGYGLSSASVTSRLNSQRPPYNVNAVTQWIAEKALGSTDFYRRRVAAIIMERQRFCQKLDELKIAYCPSSANFVLIRSLPQGKRFDGPAAAEFLAAQGYAVRCFDEPWLKGCLRLTIGRAEENDGLLEVLSAYAE